MQIPAGILRRESSFLWEFSGSSARVLWKSPFLREFSGSSTRVLRELSGSSARVLRESLFRLEFCGTLPSCGSSEARVFLPAGVLQNSCGSSEGVQWEFCESFVGVSLLAGVLRNCCGSSEGGQWEFCKSSAGLPLLREFYGDSLGRTLLPAGILSESALLWEAPSCGSPLPFLLIQVCSCCRSEFYYLRESLCAWV